MCIAIWKPASKLISYQNLEQCFKSNRDGAGFAYIENKKVVIKKGYMTFKEFWKEYENHQEKACLIHFRITTHGGTNYNNCHPFEAGRGALIHNGIISGYDDKSADSDTVQFNNKVFTPLYAKVDKTKRALMKSLIEHRIGYSKLIFLDYNGEATIFNEEKGVWDEGVWYSNTSYKITPISYSERPSHYYKERTNFKQVTPFSYKKSNTAFYIPGDKVKMLYNWNYVPKGKVGIVSKSNMNGTYTVNFGHYLGVVDYVPAGVISLEDDDEWDGDTDLNQVAAAKLLTATSSVQNNNTYYQKGWYD